jgi:hypothetical protein
LTLTNDQYRSELDVVVEEAKRELRSLFVKSEDQIKKLGTALKKVVKKEESICEEIKIALKEEIAEGVISTRTIELHCPPEWKRKTKPKQRENEKISFSKLGEEKSQEQQIAAMRDGKSVITNYTSSNTEGHRIQSKDIKELDQSEQNGISTDGNDEERSGDAGGKEELVVTHSLNGETPVNYQNEDMTDREKEMFVSHVPMSFEDLQKDMDAVSQITKEVNNIFFKVSVDLGTHEVEIEFCGITEQKNRITTSAGKGVLKEAQVK